MIIVSLRLAEANEWIDYGAGNEFKSFALDFHFHYADAGMNSLVVLSLVYSVVICMSSTRSPVVSSIVNTLPTFAA